MPLVFDTSKAQALGVDFKPLSTMVKVRGYHTTVLHLLYCCNCCVLINIRRLLIASDVLRMPSRMMHVHAR